jgi:hypothetical protein
MATRAARSFVGPFSFIVVALVAAAHCGGTTQASGDGGVDAGSDAPVEHRAKALDCPAERPPSRPRGDAGDATAPDGGADDQCAYDEECTAGKHGRCGYWPSGDAPAATLSCSYDACTTDADCSGGPCLCNPQGNTCSPGNCKTDADCAAGALCSPSLLGRVPSGLGYGTFCGGDRGYYCHTKDDECRTHADCAGVMRGGRAAQFCGYTGAEKRWTCQWVVTC